MGKIIRNGIEFSSTVDTANNISYDNSLSDLEATTAQKAIDEVAESLNNISSELSVNHQMMIRTHMSGTVYEIATLFKNLTAPIVCYTTTEFISDKPEGKYGVITITKLSDNRASADCKCTDGSYYINSWNSSTSAPTGWILK